MRFNGDTSNGDGSRAGAPPNADHDRLWKAVVSRDARFDGSFFTGVTTTGIYCRPICPARTPKRDHVRFFACAAAAEQAGFRPCRRCRPETAPGSPAWVGTASTVARALRLIDEGALDERGVDALAARLGVGDRHLRRLFDEHVGASPLAVAGTRRVHFARLLLDASTMSITEIVHASGFASVRRFQTAFRDTFACAASEVRRTGASAGRGAESAGGVHLRLGARAPYDVTGTFAFLAERAIPGVESVQDGTWRRRVRIDGRPAQIETSWNVRRAALEVRVTGAAGRDLAGIVERVRRVFDLAANPASIAACLGAERSLAKSVRTRPGLRLPTTWDPFEACVRAIVGQQISVKGARTILGRLVERCGNAFPTPEELASARLDRIGLPGARVETLRELAHRVLDGRVTIDSGASPDDVDRALRDIPGIGPWTVRYVRMRGFGDPDVFLPDDLGVRRALAHDGRMPTGREAEARAESWRPWRSYAVLHLWNGGSRDRARG